MTAKVTLQRFESEANSELCVDKSPFCHLSPFLQKQMLGAALDYQMKQHKEELRCMQLQHEEKIEEIRLFYREGTCPEMDFNAVAYSII